MKTKFLRNLLVALAAALALAGCPPAMWEDIYVSTAYVPISTVVNGDLLFVVSWGNLKEGAYLNNDTLDPGNTKVDDNKEVSREPGMTRYPLTPGQWSLQNWQPSGEEVQVIPSSAIVTVNTGETVLMAVSIGERSPDRLYVTNVEPMEREYMESQIDVSLKPLSAIAYLPYGRYDGSLAYQWYKTDTSRDPVVTEKAPDTTTLSSGSAENGKPFYYQPPVNAQGLYYYYVEVTWTPETEGSEVQTVYSSQSVVRVVRKEIDMSETENFILGRGWIKTGNVFKILDHGDEYVVTGSTQEGSLSNGNRIEVDSYVTATVRLAVDKDGKGVTIDLSDPSVGGSPFSLLKGAAVTLLIEGDNHDGNGDEHVCKAGLLGDNACAGISVPQGTSLIIDSASQSGLPNGILRAEGGFNASQRFSGAGIGGTDTGAGGEIAGQITIKGGTIIAKGKGDECDGSAGIGGSAGGSSGVITITGGVVDAKGGSSGAGIGGGGNRDGTEAPPMGNIFIKGGTVKAVGGGCAAAGIGGGYGGAGGIITISGGTVWAVGMGNYSGYAAAGIGRGGNSTGISEITISGGVVVAIQSDGGDQQGALGGAVAISGTATVIGYGFITPTSDPVSIESPAMVLATGFATGGGQYSGPTNGTTGVMDGNGIALTGSLDQTVVTGTITINGFHRSLTVPQTAEFRVPEGWTLIHKDGQYTGNALVPPGTELKAVDWDS